MYPGARPIYDSCMLTCCILNGDVPLMFECFALFLQKYTAVGRNYEIIGAREHSRVCSSATDGVR
jgi:hypothetical protein